jgi:xylulokinase
MALVGVDIGTQGTKTAVYSVDGTLLTESFEASDLRRPAPGVVEEDPDRQVMSVCRTVRECLDTSRLPAEEVDALAIDGQMAGIIGIDSEGNAITPYDSWLDTRCAPEIDLMKHAAGHEITALTGCAPSFNHGPKILWWKRNHPDVFDHIASFVQPGGYAAMKLCGLAGDAAFLDRTYLHFSGFANASVGKWSAELCGEFGIPEGKLPRIVRPEEVVGHVTREMAAECGLAPGTPVVAGCGDTAASFVSCGATREGICVDVAGTASVFAATTGAFRADTDALVLGCGRAVAEGLWHPYAYINGGGMNLEWFRELAAGLRPAAGSLSLEQLNDLARHAKSRALPYFVPHFAGRVMPPMPRLRGAWVGLDWSHGAAELYRSMLEGVAFEYAGYRDVLLDLYPHYTARELRVTGGGEKSAVWNLIKASVLDMPVVSITGNGGAPMGAAIVAGLGAGVFADAATATDQWVQTGDNTQPEDELKTVYAGRSRKYSQLLEILNDFSES